MHFKICVKMSLSCCNSWTKFSCSLQRKKFKVSNWLQHDSTLSIEWCDWVDIL